MEDKKVEEEKKPKPLWFTAMIVVIPLVGAQVVSTVKACRGEEQLKLVQDKAKKVKDEAVRSRRKLNRGWGRLAPAFGQLLDVTQKLSRTQGEILGALKAKGILQGVDAPVMEVLPEKVSKPPTPVVALPAPAAAPPVPEMRRTDRVAVRHSRLGARGTMSRSYLLNPVVLPARATPAATPDAGPPKPDQRVIKIRRLPSRLQNQQAQSPPPVVVE